jgi:AraC-like DNA-binding protein
MTKPKEQNQAEPGNAHVVKYLRSSALPGIMLVSSSFSGPMPQSTMDRRWLFARTLTGDGDVLVGKTEVRMHPGSLLALEPGDCVTPLRRRSDASTHHSMMLETEFAQTFVQSAFPDGTAKLRRGVLGTAAVRAFDALYDAVALEAAALEQEGLLATFLEAASEDVGAPLESAVVTVPVARAKKYIEEHFAEDVRLEHLEAEVGLSRFYLVRRFRAEVGMPPHAYQLAMRLDRARALVSSGMALADVAARCGFTDQSHLTRHFRRAVGVAPGAYARSTRPKR